MLLIELSPSLSKRKRSHLQKRRKREMMVQTPEELQRRQESQLKKLGRPLRKQEKPMKKLLEHSKTSRLVIRMLTKEMN